MPPEQSEVQGELSWAGRHAECPGQEYDLTLGGLDGLKDIVIKLTDSRRVRPRKQ